MAISLHPSLRGTKQSLRNTCELARINKLLNMVFQRGGCVYMLTNKYNAVFYIGVTSDIISRVWEHKNAVHVSSFTARYKCNKLVYYLYFPHIEEAIAEEKRLKGGSRESKINLIAALILNGWIFTKAYYNSWIAYVEIASCLAMTGG